MEHAIWTRWEHAAVMGDSSTTPAFDGLERLVSTGFGQAFSATGVTDPLRCGVLLPHQIENGLF